MTLNFNPRLKRKLFLTSNIGNPYAKFKGRVKFVLGMKNLYFGAINGCVVFIGGAVALFAIYAQSYLKVGPEGLWGF